MYYKSIGATKKWAMLFDHSGNWLQKVPVFLNFLNIKKMKVLVVSFRETFKLLNSEIKVLVVPFRETFKLLNSEIKSQGTGSPFQRDLSFYRLLSIEQVQIRLVC